MTQEEEKMNLIERTLDRVVLMQEQTTRNIDSLTNDIKDFGCSQSTCKALDNRVLKIENIISKLTWIIIAPMVTAVVYLIIKH